MTYLGQVAGTANLSYGATLNSAPILALDNDGIDFDEDFLPSTQTELKGLNPALPVGVALKRNADDGKGVAWLDFLRLVRHVTVGRNGAPGHPQWVTPRRCHGR